MGEKEGATLAYVKQAGRKLEEVLFLTRCRLNVSVFDKAFICDRGRSNQFAGLISLE